VSERLELVHLLVLLVTKDEAAGAI
jgi:hypothetical protein